MAKPITSDERRQVPSKAGEPSPDSTIKVQVPEQLRGYCRNASELSLAAASLRGLLEEMERAYPALHRNIRDETGMVRRHVNLFINAAHMRDCQGLDTPLAPGDHVTILPAVSGG